MPPLLPSRQLLVRNARHRAHFATPGSSTRHTRWRNAPGTEIDNSIPHRTEQGSVTTATTPDTSSRNALTLELKTAAKPALPSPPPKLPRARETPIRRWINRPTSTPQAAPDLDGGFLLYFHELFDDTPFNPEHSPSSEPPIAA